MRAFVLVAALAIVSVGSAQSSDDSAPEGGKQEITQADDSDDEPAST
jgi:hypothetical protein